MFLFNKEQFDNFIEYLYLVNAKHYYIDNNGIVRDQNETVVVRYLPHINHFGIARKNKPDIDVIVIDENSNLETIVSKIDNEAYIVNRKDLNYTNYTNSEVLDRLSIEDKPTKKGLGLFRKAS
mgnify:FL=1